MATDDRRDLPLLNPVLTLRKEPAPEPAQAGGRGAAAIVTERLDHQRTSLASDIEQVAVQPNRYAIHGGKLHLVAGMFGDSFAPSWTPKGLFDSRLGCRLIAPARSGYLVEATATQLPDFADFIRTTQIIEARVAISRVKTIRPYDTTELLHGRPIDAIWDAAAEVEGGKAFILWFAPFRDHLVRQPSLRVYLGRVCKPQSQRRIAPITIIAR